MSVRLALSTGQSQPNDIDGNGQLVLGSASEGDSEDAPKKDFRVGPQCIISFSTIRDNLAPYYISRVLKEEMNRHADAKGFIRALRMRGVDMEETVFDELKRGGRQPDEIAGDLAKEHKLTDIFPGNLAFWVYPEGNGQLAMKAGQGGGATGISVPVETGAWWAKMLYVFIPNWQLFWLADALGPGKAIPWGYVGRSFLYVLSYLGLALVAAFYMFEDRELN